MNKSHFRSTRTCRTEVLALLPWQHGNSCTDNKKILANLVPEVPAWRRTCKTGTEPDFVTAQFDAVKAACWNTELFIFFVPFVRGHVAVTGMCISGNMSASPSGIPNISIPVDAFDVFEATQHTSEHDSKHGRGSPSVEQWGASPLRSVWRVYKPNPQGHRVSWGSLSPRCTGWHLVAALCCSTIPPSAWEKTKK